MPDLLLELLSEEIPARMQAKAGADLERLLKEQLAQAGLEATSIQTFSTPRRLALIARGLPLGTPAVSEELKGPRTSAPPQALEGFLRKTGLTRDQLSERDGIWFAAIEKPGRATTDVVAEAIPAIIRAFPWPKSMRWGAASIGTESPRWVRPLQGVVAMLDEELIDFEIGDVRSSAATIGHRFHHPGRITLAGASDYVEKLRACHVIVDQEERAQLIRDGAAALAAAQGLKLVPDEGLVQENAGLTEWPVPLLGRFEPAFLDVPREVIQLTMRTNQKYFALTHPPLKGEVAGEAGRRGIGGGDTSPPVTPLHHSPAASGPPPLEGEDQGGLAPAFICVANIAATDGGERITAGNQKVLAARLADARFFWEQDLKIPLEDQAAKLGQIVFHEKLGTLADKVERVAKLARWLVEEGIVGKGAAGSNPARGATPVMPAKAGLSLPPSDAAQGSEIPASAGMTKERLADSAERAARLCKADLVTQMVGEFPELQGLIGGYLAAAQGEDPAVAAAIRDHYKPVGQGDEVPTAPVTVAVSLADKLDSITGFFSIDARPTGSRDPFALRRSALGVIELATRNGLRFDLDRIASKTANLYMHQNVDERTTDDELRHHVSRYSGAFFDSILDFFADRLKVQQRESGVRYDLIDAVDALGEPDIVRLLARVRALQAFVETPEGADLLAGYKRAANILKKEGWEAPSSAPAQAGALEGETPGLLPSQERRERGNPIALSYTPEKAEAALIAALDSAEPEAGAAVEREDFEGAMRALATLRAPVDAFFNEVTVNDPDPAKRAARLDLLARMRDAVHCVADFSRIEG